MKEAEGSTAWRGFWLIIALAATISALFWMAGGLLGGSAASVLSFCVVAAYPVGVYWVIRRARFRRDQAVQFVILGVIALCAMWCARAMFAVAVWLEPFGPPN